MQSGRDLVKETFDSIRRALALQILAANWLLWRSFEDLARAEDYAGSL